MWSILYCRSAWNSAQDVAMIRRNMFTYAGAHKAGGYLFANMGDWADDTMRNKTRALWGGVAGAMSVLRRTLTLLT